MLSDTSNRLPSEIIAKQDTRLAHVVCFSSAFHPVLQFRLLHIGLRLYQSVSLCGVIYVIEVLDRYYTSRSYVWMWKCHHA